MPEKPSEQTLQKVRKFCRELAERHALDEESREEICGHLEDKLAAYLAGEVRPTEEDALVLARAHFGDAEQVARLINDLSAAAERKLAARRWTVRWLTAAMAVQTLVVLPLAYWGAFTAFDVGTLGDPKLPRVAAGVGAILIGSQFGSFLAFITNLHRSWQRWITAVVLVPAVLFQWIVSVHGLIYLEISRPGDGQGLVRLAMQILVLWCGLSGVAGHAWLLVLVALRPPPDPVPVAAKA